MQAWFTPHSRGRGRFWLILADDLGWCSAEGCYCLGGWRSEAGGWEFGGGGIGGDDLVQADRFTGDGGAMVWGLVSHFYPFLPLNGGVFYRILPFLMQMVDVKWVIGLPIARFEG